MPEKKTMVVGGGFGAALLLAIPFIGGWEGKSNDPYNDIVGVKTVCYGETRVQMKRYTDEECLAMLHKAVEKDFMEPVAKSTPTIAERPYELAASTSLAYNIGLGSYQKSSARKLFLQGKFIEGCKAFRPWDKVRRLGKLVTSKGLVNRRKDEIKLCLQGSLSVSEATSVAASL
jgi:lysozyme